MLRLNADAMIMQRDGVLTIASHSGIARLTGHDVCSLHERLIPLLTQGIQRERLLRTVNASSRTAVSRYIAAMLKARAIVERSSLRQSSTACQHSLEVRVCGKSDLLFLLSTLDILTSPRLAIIVCSTDAYPPVPLIELVRREAAAAQEVLTFYEWTSEPLRFRRMLRVRDRKALSLTRLIYDLGLVVPCEGTGQLHVSTGRLGDGMSAANEIGLGLHFEEMAQHLVGNALARAIHSQRGGDPRTFILGSWNRLEREAALFDRLLEGNPPSLASQARQQRVACASSSPGSVYLRAALAEAGITDALIVHENKCAHIVAIQSHTAISLLAEKAIDEAAMLWLFKTLPRSSAPDEVLRVCSSYHQYLTSSSLRQLLKRTRGTAAIELMQGVFLDDAVTPFGRVFWASYR